eukprot:1154387-Pelagomonas_calceolata.AAC.2
MGEDNSVVVGLASSRASQAILNKRLPPRPAIGVPSMVHACPYNSFAILNLVAAIRVSPGLPICKFELSVWVGQTGIGTVMSAAGCNNSKVPSILRENYFLAGPGLRIAIGKFTFWNNPKLAAKLWVSSEEFGVGISYQITVSWQKHHDEGVHSLCIADGRVDSVLQDLCHGLIVIDRVADGNPRKSG